MAQAKKKKEEEVGCARPTGGPVGEESPEDQAATGGPGPQEHPAMTLRLGRKAPDFVAPAYHKGKFTSERLGDHLGKWTVLCFYPGDFTFV